VGEKNMECPHCQHDNAPSAKFCIECGFRVASDQEPIKSIPEERKFVTVLFVDISRFTSISEQMDPEQVRDLINACFDHLLQIVKKYGGKLEKYVGDAIIAVFGVPLSHENDPERAIRAGLEMMESISDFNSIHETDLNLHIGITQGWLL
jgi:class 3 adenylate cyclase